MPFRETLRRVASLINRAVLVKVNNTHKNQKWLVKGMEGQDKEVEVFEPYGWTSQPPVDEKSEVLRFSLEGYEDHTIALGASGANSRPRDAVAGEVIIYTQWDQDNAHRIHFHREKQGISLRAGNNVLHLDNEGLVIQIGENMVRIDADKLSSDQEGVFSGVSVTHHTHSGVKSGLSSTGQPN